MRSIASSSRFDAGPIPAARIMRGARTLCLNVVETGLANGVTVKAQGSVDGTVWNDLTLYDSTSTIFGAADVAVAANSGVTIHGSASAAKFRWANRKSSSAFWTPESSCIAIFLKRFATAPFFASANRGL